jgi:NAD(P)-dependent dehydrogenase (short-subunit alcohol dehydrogenase family)
MQKTIIVSGATGYLGAEVVQKLTESKYRLSLIVGKRNPQEYDHLANATSQVVDLLDEKATENFVEEVFAREGRVHGAVLLVGGFAVGDIKNTADEDIRNMMNVNFLTAFHMVRPLLERFEAQGHGQIILVGSKAAMNPVQGASAFAYTLSKKMLLNLAEMINAQYSTITASVIVPSTMDTPATRSAMPNADYTQWVSTRDVAESIDFLLSEAGSQLREPVLKIYNHA